MTELMLTILSSSGFFAWGMCVQGWLTRRKQIKARERRIVIDAPFSPEQSETIMQVLVSLNEAVRKSTEVATQIEAGRLGSK